MRKIIMTVVMLGLASGAHAAGFADLAGKAAGLNASAAAVPAAAIPAGRPSALDPAANKQLAEKLDIPVFYALPESAYARSSGEISSSDGFLEFLHPGAAKAAVPVGLRVYLTKHENVAKRLGGGLVQTGDILLTFRPEWGFSGPYPNIQMGVSHAGLAIVDNGVVSNVDNPLSGEYLGELDGKHYKETRALHIIRPRGLSEEQKTNIKDWAEKLTAQAPQIYPAQLSFNRDYFSPKYTPDLKLSERWLK